MRNPEIIKFVLYHLKIINIWKHAVKKLPFVIRYVHDWCKTQQICDKAILENCKTLESVVPDCYKSCCMQLRFSFNVVKATLKSLILNLLKLRFKFLSMNCGILNKWYTCCIKISQQGISSTFFFFFFCIVILFRHMCHLLWELCQWYSLGKQLCIHCFFMLLA